MYTEEMLENIAKVGHEANRAYCQTLGDDSQKPWDEVSDEQKAFVAEGVQFHLDNPGADASASHAQWYEMKKRDGWTYGEEKDEEKKNHPNFVPFVNLPVEQQRKDALFAGVVNALRS